MALKNKPEVNLALKTIRENLGLTRAEMSIVLGYPDCHPQRAYYCRVEAGYVGLTNERMWKLMQISGCTFGQIIGKEPVVSTVLPKPPKAPKEPKVLVLSDTAKALKERADKL